LRHCARRVERFAAREAGYAHAWKAMVLSPRDNRIPMSVGFGLLQDKPRPHGRGLSLSAGG
jgi:hypothetical protein